MNQPKPAIFIVEVAVFDEIRIEGVIQALKRDHRVLGVKRLDEAPPPVQVFAMQNWNPLAEQWFTVSTTIAPDEAQRWFDGSPSDRRVIDEVTRAIIHRSEV